MDALQYQSMVFAVFGVLWRLVCFFDGDLFNFDRFVIQLLGVAAAFTWAFPLALIMYVVLAKTLGLRVSAQNEQSGLDFAEYAEIGYPEFSQSKTFYSSELGRRPRIDRHIRKQAVYTLLSRYLPKEALGALMDLWGSEYALKLTFVVNDFLGEVRKRHAHITNHATLYRELLQLLNGPSSALLSEVQSAGLDQSTARNAQQKSQAESPEGMAKKSFSSDERRYFCSYCVRAAVGFLSTNGV